MKEPKFKGGPIFLNSGGTGPDDYLLKPIRGGRWHRVICRYGRHYQNDQDAAEADRKAFENIMRAGVEHMAVGDNAIRWRKMLDGDVARTDVLTVNASEFWETYRDYQPNARTQLSTVLSTEARTLFDHMRKDDHRTVRGELEWLIEQEAQRRGIA